MPSCIACTGLAAVPSPTRRSVAKTVSEIALWVPWIGREMMSTASDATPAAPRTSLREVPRDGRCSSSVMPTTISGTGRLQVLAGVRGGVDLLALRRALARDQRADVHDPLALLARDAGPVVGVGGVGQVLGLGELVDHRVD